MLRLLGGTITPFELSEPTSATPLAKDKEEDDDDHDDDQKSLQGLLLSDQVDEELDDGHEDPEHQTEGNEVDARCRTRIVHAVRGTTGGKRRYGEAQSRTDEQKKVDDLHDNSFPCVRPYASTCSM